MINRNLFCGLLLAMLFAAPRLTAAPVVHVPDIRIDAAADTLANYGGKRSRQQSVAKSLGYNLTDNYDEGSFTLDLFSKENFASYYDPARLLPDDPSYIPDSVRVRFTDNIFLGFGFGVGQIAPLGDYHYNLSETYNLNVGYQFRTRKRLPVSSLRFSTQYGRFISDEMPESMVVLDMGLDYMYNLSNKMRGDDERRRLLDISLVSGLGAVYSFTSDRHVWSPRVRFGLNFDRRMSGNSHFYVEPYMTFVRNGFDASPDNPRKYDIMWGVYAGMRVDLNSAYSRQRLYMPDYNPNVFYDMAAGYQWYWMQSVGNSLNRTIGGECQLSVGKWFDPLLGVRVGVAACDYYWRGQSFQPTGVANTQVSPGYAEFYKGADYAGRLELLFQPLNLFYGWRRFTRDIELDIVGGFEFGSHNKTHVEDYGTLKQFYLGYTMAVDLLYRIAPGVKVYIEPRVRFDNFTVQRAINGREGNFTDKFCSLQLGLRLQRPLRVERERLFPGEFEPGLEIGVMGGSGKLFRLSKLQASYPFNWDTGLAANYHISAYHGVGLEADYMCISDQLQAPYSISSGNVVMGYTGLVKRTVNVLNTRLLYRLNLSNALMFRNWDRRRFNLYGLIGPSYSYVLNTNMRLVDGMLAGGTGTPTIYANDMINSHRASLGMFVSFAASYSISSHVSVMVRPEAQWHVDSKFLDSDFSKSVVLRVNAGIEYRF